MMKRILAVVSMSALPVLALAQGLQYTPSSGIGGLFVFFGNILKQIVPLVISIAVIYFIWQVFQYTIAGDEEKKAEAKTHIIYGIIGLFVMVSVWGLVAILQSTLGTTGITTTINNQLPL